jgi:hypothetical protein
MEKNRELLTYERMGTTVDANGNPLAFHVIQSIEHAKWPVDSVKGAKRESTSICYLYRRHNNRVQCFLWANVEDASAVSKRLAEYVVAGNLLNIVYSAECAEAKKCTALIDTSVPKTWSSNAACHVCFKGPGLLDTNRTCAGCSQCVCKSCSCFRPVFKIDKKTNKPMEGRFCKLCVAKVISSPSTQTLRQRLNSDPTRRNSLQGKSNRERSSSEQQKSQPQQGVSNKTHNVYASRDYDDSEISWRSRSVFLPNGGFKTNLSDSDLSAFTDSALTLEHLSVSDASRPSESDEPSFYKDVYDSSFVSDSSFDTSSFSSSIYSSRRQSHSSSRVDGEIWTTGALNSFDLGPLRLSDSSVASSTKHSKSRHYMHQQWPESEF